MIYIYIEGVQIKLAVILKSDYSITKRLAENVKTILDLWRIGL